MSGATGFIGRDLCQQLLERGDSIVALSKSGAPLPDGTATLAVDLAREMPKRECLDGVDVVFHLAGIAHQKAEAAAYRTLNELATLQLARLAAAAGVKRFIFLSSVKAMGPPTGDTERSEGDCAAPRDPYGWSKWSAENALQAEFGSGPMALVILRPALVYGPAAKGNLALLARGLKAGLPRPPALGARSMVALGDLVDLMCLAAGQAQTGVQIWIASDGEHYSTRSLYDELRLAAGMGPGRGWLPTAGWRVAAALLDLVSRARGESTFDKLFGTELYSNRAVLQATGWRPRRRFSATARELMGAVKEGVG
ncbi:MAG: NAD-dependent epimerase/dehydratase family protein [Pseudomonadales bacterium]|nr:NAD-dependent epimerase/dehydratase family protein [Halioglobus sp.]MCP5131190.1 NAD-dependent epimerase/dehydratase family protein [Pseudomonadales bacterium]